MGLNLLILLFMRQFTKSSDSSDTSQVGKHDFYFYTKLTVTLSKESDSSTSYSVPSQKVGTPPSTDCWRATLAKLEIPMTPSN